MDIGDAVTSSHHCLVEQVVGEPDARREVVVIRIEKPSVAISRLDYCVRLGIVVREAVLIFIERRREFVSQAEVQGQPRVDFEIILDIAEMQSLAQMYYEQVGQLIL